jgi:hypothetical protein
MADYSTTTTTSNPGRPAHTTTTTTSSGSGMGFILGAVVVALAILGFLLFAGSDDTAQPVTDTTQVIEPGAADGGADQPITTEPNAAGTDADPAIEGSATIEAEGTATVGTEGTTGN